MKKVKAQKFIQEGRTLAYELDNEFSKEKKKYMFWGILPDEECEVNILRTKKGINYCEVVELIKKSSKRIPEIEDHYLSCSPFSILEYEYELQVKEELLAELFSDYSDEFNLKPITDYNIYNYRNKIEYNFWEVEKDNPETLEFSFFVRESKRRIIIDSCILATEKINKVAKQILALLRKGKYSSYNLKSLVLRESDQGIIASLFIKDRIEIDIDFSSIDDLFLFEIHFSDHRAPVSRSDELLFSSHNLIPTYKVLDKRLSFSSQSFTQINIPLFEEVLTYIREYIEVNNLVDYKIFDIYCGVGSIGLSIISNTNQKISFLDNNNYNIQNLIKNIEQFKLKNTDIKLSDDSKSDFIFEDKSILVLDPPRAGLSANLIDSILSGKAEHIFYLSCNPITLSRDLKLLKDKYRLVGIKPYNFFPRTPHIEVLTILGLR